MSASPVQTIAFLSGSSTLDLGRFAGIIFAIILLVDCLFFMFLEWYLPADTLDKVEMHWEHENFEEVSTRPECTHPKPRLTFRRL